MEEYFKLVWSTILLRPYVFIFLITFIFIAYQFFGWRRTIIFTLTAWVIAFLSEYSSITNGFPYGDYQYTYLTQLKDGEVWKVGEKELFLFGVVPFIDSLSYTFLSFIGYALSVYVFSPLIKLKNAIIPADTYSIRYSFRVAFLGALIITFMDVIIDPVATLGSKWFLGEIHRYTHPGYYFGIPLTNYLGWFFTSFLILFLFQRVDSFLSAKDFFSGKRNSLYPHKLLLLTLLYLGVVGFNLVVTVLIGEYHMAISGFLIQTPILIFLLIPVFQKHSVASEEEILAHLRDFPCAELEKSLAQRVIPTKNNGTSLGNELLSED